MWRPGPLTLTIGSAVLLASSTISYATVHAQSAAGDRMSGVLLPGAALLQPAIAEARDASPDEVHWDRVETFYAERSYQPAWLVEPGRSAARVLVQRMAASDEDALNPAHYDPTYWVRWLEAPPGDMRTLVAGDVELTGVLLRFAEDLSLGFGNDADQERRDAVVQRLVEAQDAGSAVTALDRLTPAHIGYAELRRALARYRSLAADDGWEPVPEGVLLRRDGGASRLGGHDLSEVLRALCERLRVTGDLHAEPGACEPRQESGQDGEEGEEEENALRYDERLEEAVRRFQTRHGLGVDGIVGPKTIAALNVPVEARVRQIALNMNRWRALPPDPADPHVLVNIPGFRLQVVEDNRPVMTMRVVSGRTDRRTPIMSDEISYLELRPYWNVPDSITRRDLLPRIRRDPSYLTRNRYEVIDGWSKPVRTIDPQTIDWSTVGDDFPYRLRQRPGRHNSMGLVKFMFPNQHAVYLHDTPSQHLFDRRPRAFSSGCVRVEDPVALADFLLRSDPSWTPATIEAAMNTGDRQVVQLPQHVPVHLRYFTAFMDGDVVHFRPDIYGHDGSDGDSLPSLGLVPAPAG